MARQDDAIIAYQAISLANLATSAIGAGVAVGAWGWSVTNLTHDRTISGSESTAANIAASLATLIKDLIDRGILKGSVS